MILPKIDHLLLHKVLFLLGISLKLHYTDDFYLQLSTIVHLFSILYDLFIGQMGEWSVSTKAQDLPKGDRKWPDATLAGVSVLLRKMK